MSGSIFSSLLVLVMLLNFYCLGTSRIRALIQGVSLQGVLLGIMPLLVHEHLEVLPVLMSIMTVAIKGVVIPLMLLHALRELPIKREVEPFLGFVTSLVLAAVGTALAVAFAQNLPLGKGITADSGAHLVVAASLATVFSGFLILITRLKAVTQIVGYLVLENGVFIFGMLLVEAMPFFVEVGILLDLVVGIFVMGIIVNHISREFPSDSTERLSTLKE
ncbi:MAG: hydrogenase [Myxococcota bacterium]